MVIVRLSKKAFTLIEMLVAIVIIGISIIGLMEMSVITMRNNVKNEIRNSAIRVLTNHINKIRAEEYEDIKTTIKEKVVKIRNFSVTFTLSDIVSEKTYNSKQYKVVDSTISWNYLGKSYNYTIHTVVNND